MRITNISIENFRFFDNRKKINLDSPLVLCDDPNGSGKTTILDAIEWCLTGNVRRLYDSYQSRYKSNTKNKENSRAMVHNKKLPDKPTIVVVTINDENRKYICTRTQEKKAVQIDDPGEFVITDEVGTVQNENIVSRWVKDFYDHHVFNMQRTYSVQASTKKNLDDMFNDFVPEVNKADRVVENLDNFIKCIEKKITIEEQKKISNDQIEDLKKQIGNAIASPEKVTYPSKKMYSGEQSDISVLDKVNVNLQISKLYACGCKKAVMYNNVIHDAEKNKEIASLLKKLLADASDNGVLFKYVEKRLYNSQTLEQLRIKKRELGNIKVTRENIKALSHQIVGLKNSEFTDEYWDQTNDKIEKVELAINDLKKDVELYTEGDDVLRAMTSLISTKEGIIQYRVDVIKQHEELACPLCGSTDNFATINDNDLLQRASDFIAKHNKALEEKNQKLIDDKKIWEDLCIEAVDRARKSLIKSIDEIEKVITSDVAIINEAQSSINIVDKLMKIDDGEYAFDKFGNLLAIQEMVKLNESKIVEEQKLLELQSVKREIENELQKFLGIDEYCDLNNAITIRSKDVPNIEFWDMDLWKKKIVALKQFETDKELSENKNKLREYEEKNFRINSITNDLDSVEKIADERKNKIRELIKQYKEQEFKEVGPYLTRVYHKLSEGDENFAAFQLSKPSDNELLITDGEENPIMNMLSDGQLSVFLLAYFLGNAFRIAKSGSEEMHIYLMDDIGSCLDDVNMLAFLDLVKYQLLDKNGVFDQMFFFSCDTKIQKMLRWKADACGLKYININIMNEQIV